MKRYRHNNYGFGLVEIVIAVAILSFSLFSLFLIFELSLRAEEKTTNRIKASFLLEEGIEAVKIMRDSGWGTSLGTLSSGTDYYLVFDGSNWQTSGTPSMIDGLYERKFIAEDVLRDVNDDIAVAGVIDPGTKKIIFNVSWQERGATTTSSVSSYITDIFNN